MTNRIIGAGFKSHGQNRTVINFIDALAEFSCEGLILNIDKDSWWRTTAKRLQDPNVIFPDILKIGVLGIQSNQERFNFGMFSKVYCKVKQYDGQETDVYVLRTFPIITDGKLNMQSLDASLNQYLFLQFSDAGILAASDEQKLVFQLGKMYKINLQDMDLVSSGWANPRVLDLVRLLKLERELIAKRESLKDALLEQPPVPRTEISETAIPFHREESPKGVEIKKSYEVSAVVYGLVDKKIKTSGTLPKLDFSTASGLLRDTESELQNTRTRIRCIVFACEAIGSKIIPWRDHSEIPYRGNKKYNLEYQLADFEGTQLFRMAWKQQVSC